MRIRTKLIAQVILALVLALVLKYILDVPDLYLPGIRFHGVHVQIELGCVLHPDRSLHHRGRLATRSTSPMGWTGWPG